MRAIVVAFLTLLVGVFSSVASATADDFRAYDIEIILPWAQATPLDQTRGAVFMKLSNTGDIADRLIHAASPLAAQVTVMPLHAVTIPPGEVVFLEPGGLHLELTGLTAPLVEGTTVPVTLSFERGGTVAVTAVVGAVGATEPPAE